MTVHFPLWLFTWFDQIFGSNQKEENTWLIWRNKSLISYICKVVHKCRHKQTLTHKYNHTHIKPAWPSALAEPTAFDEMTLDRRDMHSHTHTHLRAHGHTPNTQPSPRQPTNRSIRLAKCVQLSKYHSAIIGCQMKRILMAAISDGFWWVTHGWAQCFAFEQLSFFRAIPV